MRPITMADLLEQSDYQVRSLRRNQEVKGKIIAVSPSEILVDIGAKSEGIIAGRELIDAVDIVSNLSVGDTLSATVLYPENDAGQVVLSLRKLSEDIRWRELEEKRESDEEIEVAAAEANRGGLICDYLGIRGFVPASQLVGAPTDLSDLIGRTITVRIIEVDRNSNRLILSQKSPDTKDIAQIQKLLSQINIGDTMAGIVTAVLPFGVFVEVGVAGPVTAFPPAYAKASAGKPASKGSAALPLEARQSGVGSPSSRATRGEDVLEKLEGLVHISEISWEKVEDPAKYFKVGDSVNVMVIAKDESVGRLNLSIKQLSDDPFLEISKRYAKDQNVSGKVARVTPYGVFVTLEDGVEGLIHISKISPNVEYEVGQAVECTVEAVETKARRVTLSPVVREKPILYR